MRYFICADVGCNFWLDDKHPTNNINHLKALITQAALIGINAVKFQYFSVNEIKDYEKKQPRSSYTPEIYTLIEKAELSLDQMKKIKGWCDNAHIEFMATPFLDPERVKDLDPLVSRHKIRERDSNNLDLVREALNTKKPVYVSQTKHYIDRFFDPNYRQVFCIPQYPASWESFGTLVRGIRSLEYFKGYSNHIPEIGAPLLACAMAGLGRPREFYLEVHYKLLGTSPVDDAVSFEAPELRILVKVLRQWEKVAESVKLDDVEETGFLHF